MRFNMNVNDRLISNNKQFQPAYYNKRVNKPPRLSLCKVITTAAIGALMFFSGRGVATTNHLILNPSPIPLNGTGLLQEHLFKPVERAECQQLGVEKTNSRVNLLSCELFDAAKTQCFDQSNALDMNTVKQARNGYNKGYTFFPNDLPLVFKGQDIGGKHERMEQASRICVKNNYKHIEIANSTLLGGYIIEERIPFDSISIKKQIALYLNNLDLFIEPVKEFTGLLCQCWIGDLNSENHSGPYENLAKTIFGRYDNVVPYLEQRDGNVQIKIGMVDLDGFNPKAPDRTTIIKHIENAVFFFPHHLDVIIQETSKYIKLTTDQKLELASIRDEVLKGFHLLGGHHLEFLRKNGISPLNPKYFAKIHPNDKAKHDQDLTNHIYEHILKVCRNEINDGFSYFLSGILEVNPENVKNVTLDQIKEKLQNCFTPEILDLVRDYISNAITLKVDKANIRNEGDLIEERTLEFNRYLIVEKLAAATKLDRKYENCNYEILYHYIFHGMMALEECSYYNFNFGTAEILFC